MVRVAHEATSDAPPSAVWAVLAEFDRLADWGPGIGHSSWMTADPPGVGAKRRVQVGPIVLLERITTWEIDERLAYELEGLPPMIRSAINTWTITPDGAGSRVELAVEVEPGPRPPMKAAAKALATRVGKVNEGLLGAALARAEGGVAA